MSKRATDVVNPHVLGLHPYVPGTQPAGDGWIKLNTNELPYPPSPRVAEGIAAEVPRLSKYPSPTSALLRAAVAELHGVDPSQVIIGNGSDEILTLLVRAFAGPGRAVGETFPSYSLYSVLAAIQEAQVHSIPLDPEGSLPVEAIGRCAAPLFFLTTPNAPFGYGYALSDLARAVGAFGGVFVADEAYVDFGDASAVGLLASHPNLVVTRTFSKSYGLAGLRVGYAVASRETIELLDRVRDSYNVNRLSQAGALAAVRDQAYLQKVVGRIRATRERFSATLREHGWRVAPSQTNFVFARPPLRNGDDGAVVAADFFGRLEAARILVRYFPHRAETCDGLRISIGTDDEMERCLEVLLSRGR